MSDSRAASQGQVTTCRQNGVGSRDSSEVSVKSEVLAIPHSQFGFRAQH